MTRKYILLFILLCLGFWALSTAVFGHKGLFYNKQLEIILNEIIYEERALDVELDALKNRSNELQTSEGLRESALNLGYSVQGDRIYIFNERSYQDSENDFPTLSFVKNDEEEFFKPFDFKINAIIALGASAVVTFINFICSGKKKETNNDNTEDRKEGNSDNFIDYV